MRMQRLRTLLAVIFLTFALASTFMRPAVAAPVEPPDALLQGG